MLTSYQGEKFDQRNGFNLVEVLVAICIISCGIWFVSRFVLRQGSSPPPRHHVHVALNSIQGAMLDCFSETGHAPTEVDDLRTLAVKYLEVDTDPGDLLTKMVMEGVDYWGNRIVILPVSGNCEV